MKKLIDFKNAEEIQAYANRNNNGNFNEAVRELVAKGLLSDESTTSNKANVP